MTSGRFLGVDGGGTKTEFVLVDERLQTLASWLGPSCSYFGFGTDLVRRVLAEGVAQVCASAAVLPTDLDQAFFALPGYGESSADVSELSRIPAAILGHDRYDCGNDAVAAWAGSLAGEDGINVVAGTGSITYGVRAGLGRRVGGWGEIFGDEGSAYWIAVRGLRAFARMSDRRSPRGPLYELMKQVLDVEVDLDVISLVSDRWQGRRDRVAALSRTVSDAALAGDDAAAGILTDAGTELAALVDANRTVLGYRSGETTPVSYSGGAFRGAGVLDSFRRALGSDYELREPVHGPAVGAAITAMRGRSAGPAGS